MERLKLLILFGLICIIHALPMKEKVKEADTHNKEPTQGQGDDWEINLEYGRYLKEVVQALESDPEFRKKLETANVEDIKSGKIARELPYVEHHVRTKLDELKRSEIERLRHLAMQENEKKHGVDRTRLKIPVHVDHRNPTKFESEDLRKLIIQLNVDLEKLDKERQVDFKKYEMEKEFEYKEDLKKMDEPHKKEAVEKHDSEIKKHKEHPKLHHPGSKQQFEEVWEGQDHMKSEDFEPTTFFHLHDLDGNNYWDENEVKALFQKELDKMYDPNAPEDDQRERHEEMERMREHVFRETDTNQDKLISFDEFLVQTRKSEFERDDGWEGLDEQEIYSQQEYERYEDDREAEIRHLIETGQATPEQKLQYQQQQQQRQQQQQQQQQQFQQPPQQQQQGQQFQQVPPQQYQQQQFQQPPQQYQQQPPQQYQQQPPQQQQQQPPQQQVPQGQQPQGPNPPSKQNALAQENLGKPSEPALNNHIIK